MASRIVSRAMGAARARPMARTADAGVPQKSPQETANSILNSLPGNSVASKVAYLSAGTGLAIAGISNELLVINEEAIVAFALLSVYYGLATYGGPAYASWAQGQREKTLNILNASREGHKEAVKARIESVKDLGGVIDVTKNLFEVAKTAKLEAQAYELEQKTAITSEAKATLDSWVRYESQVKQRQQKELADAVMAKIEKELENPKVLDQILKQSVQDIERIVSQKA
ncbi:hypothetical protein AMS68_003478 [Peltaster fructicola]|uniref:ATP synthase subunit 4 n=1 Tax=Peltaster fructicola TaxID=286661 RepID=A0A6H0XTG4_9PEZI|nr:hypothetical protein AMS68_003478 [Peltaster fructicola]